MYTQTFDLAFDQKGRSRGFAVPSSGIGGCGGALRRIGRHQAIFFEGDTANNLCEIVDGVVKLTKLLMDGRGLILCFCLPGEVLGLTVGDAHNYTAETVTDTCFRCIPRSRVSGALSDGGALAQKLLGAACFELEAANEHLMLLGLKNPRERVATFLTSYARRLHAPDDPSLDARVVVALPMSRRDIAEHLGLTPETVCRVFGQLRRQRLIDAPPSGDVVIRDWAALESLAEGAD